MKQDSLNLSDFGENMSGEMKRLGDLVVLAGPNGAGKSRALRCLEKAVPRGVSIRPFPTRFALQDNRKLSPETQAQQSSILRGTVGDVHVDQRAVPYLSEALKSFAATQWNAQIVHAGAEKRWEELNSLVHQLLGEPLGTGDGYTPTLFGRPIPDAMLSEGQKALLQIAVRLHAHSAKLDGQLLVIDEPETHLHPAVLVDTIERLRQLNVGQIWIATHSIPLLAALPTESFWFVHEGTVSYAGKEPEKVLNGLLGGDKGRANIEEFLRLPAQLASNRFAAECLLPPGVVDTGAGDPQATQLHEFLALDDKSSRVLDYGAGRGRLLVALQELANGSDTAFAIDYHAYEPFPQPELQGRLDDAYDDDHRRFHNSIDELDSLSEHSFDVVVMCNVLHELSPQAWKEAFGEEGHVTRLLKTEGCLLVLEDTEIPTGEKAHEHGFLLLGKPQLYRLFGIASDTNPIPTLEKRDGRLKAYSIAASHLRNVTGNSIRAALKSLVDCSLRDAHSMSKGELKSSREGRLYALWCQSHMNATLALKALS